MNRIFILVSLLTSLVWTGCTSGHSEKKDIETKFLVTSPVKKDTAVTVEYVCQISSIQHIELRAQERGYLQHIYVDEGQFVKEGQLLFKIMPGLYEAELKKAQAEVKFAEIEMQNTKVLADSNIVAPNELAMARAKYDKAMAELALAEVHLQFTEIRAPFDGIIDRFHVRQGSLLEEGELLSHLSDNRKMWIYYNVPEAEYLDYMSKAKKDSVVQVTLMMANNKQFGYPGIVETIEADFNNETGNIPFRATFPNPEGLLRHGETGNIQMTVPIRNAVIIPQKASFDILDKKYVFVVDEQNVVHSREIIVSADLEDIFVVSEGLRENEKILLEGIRKVRDKDKIAFDFEDGHQVIADLKLPAE